MDREHELSGLRNPDTWALETWQETRTAALTVALCAKSHKDPAHQQALVADLPPHAGLAQVQAASPHQTERNLGRRRGGLF